MAVAENVAGMWQAGMAGENGQEEPITQTHEALVVRQRARGVGMAVRGATRRWGGVAQEE